MAEQTIESVYAYKYLFEVQTKNLKGGFSRVSGISEEIEVVDMRDGTDPFQIRKIRGTKQGGTITLERGIVQNRREMFAWFASVKANDVPFWANALVSLNTRKNTREADKPVFTMEISSAWPSKYEISELDAKASDLSVEILSLAHEGLEYSDR